MIFSLKKLYVVLHLIRLDKLIPCIVSAYKNSVAGGGKDSNYFFGLILPPAFQLRFLVHNSQVMREAQALGLNSMLKKKIKKYIYLIFLAAQRFHQSEFPPSLCQAVLFNFYFFIF